MKQIYSLAVLLLFSFFASAQQPSSADTGEVNPGKQLIILQTSDTHSRIEPISPEAADDYAGMGGAVRRSSFIKEIRSKHPDVLLFDCGDISQGTPYYNLFQGEVEIKMMNLMKYDAMTIGNHEFDFGLDNMARLFRMANFPVVCSNYDVTGTVLEGLVKPYIILERSGVRIGVFGLAPRMEGLVQADKCEGIVYNNPIEVGQEMADFLKLEKNCDVVICLSHLGIRNSYGTADEDLVSKTRNIDVILGGHSHTFMEKPMNYLNADGKNVPVSHTGKNGIFVGELKLTLAEK
ncbi:bifunctional metallophosphatase/5'-nucleotidase [Bacteroides fluxus]|uniref:bifunctional metallophosphatase/5'-nucleotidase n=1 Tax=Bacteroides fluxus TaxID=626930 RepID=UPI002352E5C5|nr:metallophosphatase [Bacteroides fluxus]MDY3788578.1 metallophosphatase [Bacteroides fluxus]